MENSEAKKLKISRFLKWVEFQDTVEQQLKDLGFQKVPTPSLVTSGAMESQLETFKTKSVFGSAQRDYELPTSPEFHLKKALAMGLKDIFEIKTCYRNEEFSDCHRPEFTMLEFYKVDCKLDEFISLTMDFLTRVSDAVHFRSSPLKYRKLKIADLFASLGLKLSPDSEIQDLKNMAHQAGVDISETDSIDDIYFRIWLEKIEPFFDPNEYTVVHSYPPFQSALAKLSDEGWAERFEIYSHGLELGNAYEELADASIIEQRWQAENQKRMDLKKAPHVMDHDFLKALDHMPKCCGIAIGLERLFMSMYGFKKISDFKIFEDND